MPQIAFIITYMGTFPWYFPGHVLKPLNLLSLRFKKFQLSCNTHKIFDAHIV